MAGIEDEVNVGDKVTLTEHIITKNDWASIGVDVNTEFTITDISTEVDPWAPAALVLVDEFDSEYVVSRDEVIFL
jgi:hypothetical protein